MGKSTVAVNLALALQAQGGNGRVRVGLLDADIYGPSQPHMLGVHNKPMVHDDKSIEPIMAHGLQTMSIAYLIDTQTPAVWRGPMVSGALQTMLTSTRWNSLDYLIIDLPPGTGDIQLTMAQKIPVCGAVIVTTPQSVALLDVNKAIGMFMRVKVPIFGVVENMSVHICTNCGQQDHIFGSGGGAALAAQHAVPFLGALPLQREIQELADIGKPIVLASPLNPASQVFFTLAAQVVQQLTKLKRDFSAPVASVVIEEN